MELQPNEFLCLEGEKSNTLYIVKSGSLEATSTHSEKKREYGPGSLIGEFSLLEGAPCRETVKAITKSELQVISNTALDAALAKEPNWLKSILTFLAARTHIAHENLKKSNKVKALPTLLYLLAGHGETVALQTICDEVRKLFNIDGEETEALVKLLEELDLLKLQAHEIHIQNPRIVKLLYNTICYRALHKKVAPSILSMTDQMVLTAIVKAVQESHEPIVNGIAQVKTCLIKDVSKKAMHGMTLTLRAMIPLVEKKLLAPSNKEAFGKIDATIDDIPFFYANFDRILDLLELNRIFPLLDKKLVS